MTDEEHMKKLQATEEMLPKGCPVYDLKPS